MDLCFPNGSISVLLTILSIGRIPFLQYSHPVAGAEIKSQATTWDGAKTL